MRQRVVRWGFRTVGWLSALVMCTHCGGVAEQDGPLEEAPPETRQAALEADCWTETVYEAFGSQRLGDTYVDPARPTSNFSDEDVLLVDGSPRLESYLKFGVENEDADFPIVGARLTLFARDGSRDGPALYRTSTGWSEETLTYAIRPAPQGEPLGDLGSVESDTSVEYDVSAAVRRSGEYAFALLPTSGDGVDFESSRSSHSPCPSLTLTRAVTFCSRQGTGGGLQWVQQYGGPGEERPMKLAAAPEGGWVISGGLYSAGDFGGGPLPSPVAFVLAKYGPQGQHIWSRGYPANSSNFTQVTLAGITVTPLGNVLVAGSYVGDPDLGTGRLPLTWGDVPGIFIAKFSPNGTPVWARGFFAGTPQVGSPQKAPARALAIATDATGSLHITGAFQGQLDLGGGPLASGATASGKEGLFVARFSWEGQHLWSRAHGGGAGGSEGQALTTDSTGAVLMAGVASPHSSNTRLGVQGPRTPFVAKYTAEGSLQWSRALNGAQAQMRGVVVRPGDAVAFTATFTGAFPFAGRTYSASLDDPYLSRTDIILGALSAAGSDQWGRQLGDPAVGDRAEQLAVDAQGRLTLTGLLASRSDLGAGPIGHPRAGAFFMARYAPDGSHVGSRGMRLNISSQLAVNAAGEALLSSDLEWPAWFEGTLYSPQGSNDVLLMKFAP
jgi:hypothetical protein